MNARHLNPLKQGMLWWMFENQDLYRQDAMARMNRMTGEQRTSRPSAGLHSPLWLLVHLAEIERHYVDILQESRSSQNFLTVPSEQPEPNQWPPWDELRKFVSDTRTELEEHLRQMEDQDFARQYGHQPYFTGAWIVGHILEHESFHMGQLRWALRMLEA